MCSSSIIVALFLVVVPPPPHLSTHRRFEFVPIKRYYYLKVLLFISSSELSRMMSSPFPKLSGSSPAGVATMMAMTGNRQQPQSLEPAARIGQQQQAQSISRRRLSSFGTSGGIEDLRKVETPKTKEISIDDVLGMGGGFKMSFGRSSSSKKRSAESAEKSGASKKLKTAPKGWGMSSYLNRDLLAKQMSDAAAQKRLSVAPSKAYFWLPRLTSENKNQRQVFQPDKLFFFRNLWDTPHHHDLETRKIKLGRQLEKSPRRVHDDDDLRASALPQEETR